MGEKNFSKYSSDDIESLIEFLKWVKSDFEEIINRYVVLVPEHQTYINQLLEGLPEILEQIQESQKWLRNKRPIDELKKHGLIGYQLTLKLEMVEIARIQNQHATTTHNMIWDAHQPNEKTVDVGILDRIRSPFRSLERRLKINLLTVFCTILGSLSDIVPGLGAINEFKDVIKDALTIKN